MIEAVLVPHEERMNFLPRHLGRLTTNFEALCYSTARRYTDYTGGYWEFYSLKEDGNEVGMYIAPSEDRLFTFQNPDNYSDVKLTSDALGIVCCLYAFSLLSFSSPEVSDYFHVLREFASGSSEFREILTAID